MAQKKKALLVLEQPWWTPDENPKRASVLPFVNGLERFLDFVNVYYSTFYERNSFEMALKNDLSLIKEKSAVLYIAAHGSKGGLGSSEFRAMKISTFIKIISEVAKKTKIEGVIIGACEVGLNKDNLKKILKGTNISWLFAYTASVDWFNATLLELSILHQMLKLKDKNLQDKEAIFEAVFNGIKIFNPLEEFGEDDNEEVYPLSESFLLLIQEKKRGAHVIDFSEKLHNELVKNLVIQKKRMNINN